MGRKCLWQNSKMVINYVQMINSEEFSITLRQHVPVSSVMPLEIFHAKCMCIFFMANDI